MLTAGADTSGAHIDSFGKILAVRFSINIPDPAFTLSNATENLYTSSCSKNSAKGASISTVIGFVKPIGEKGIDNTSCPKPETWSPNLYFLNLRLPVAWNAPPPEPSADWVISILDKSLSVSKATFCAICWELL